MIMTSGIFLPTNWKPTIKCSIRFNILKHSWARIEITFGKLQILKALSYDWFCEKSHELIITY